MSLDLDKLEALDKAATPGPWRTSMSGYSIKSDDERLPIIACVHGGMDATDAQLEAFQDNAALIAEMRTQLPALLQAARERDEARARIADLEAVNAECVCDTCVEHVETQRERAEAMQILVKVRTVSFHDLAAGCRCYQCEIGREAVAFLARVSR